MPGKALEFYLKEKTLAEAINDKKNLAWIYHKVAFSLIRLKRFEEAAYYAGKAKKTIDSSPDSLANRGDLAQYYDALGQILMGKQKYPEALSNFRQAINISNRFGFTGVAIYFNMYIAQCYQKMGNLKESINYGLLSYEEATLNPNSDKNYVIPRVCRLLFENYDSLNNSAEAYKYLKIEYKYRKKIEKQNAVTRLAEMEIQSIVRKSEQEKNRLEQARLVKEKENQNQRWWLFSIAAALFSAVVLAFIFYRNNHHKQKANLLLHRQKEEIDHQRDKAEKALIQLQSTQTQLIQKEKLASLGELTAGIAHEIQNPLNFVNNFSELSVDLAKELKEEVEKPEIDKELVMELANDLTQNQEKIHHHGKRASSIVKGMLEHSRTGTGERVATDLNKLADEYLRLSYHGMKAKNKDFQSDFELLADSNLPKINIVPQEIGRVLLNLLNNAFYSVKNVESPKVIVSILQTDKQVIIEVQDNGTGISDLIKAKIFQPFFTTKPTGEGTGLGLSLSYDIITKGHGGTLTGESTEGLGSAFIITLPIM